MAEPPLDVQHEISRRQFVDQIENRVAHEDVIIEIQHVKPDHEIGLAEALDQFVHTRFVEDLIAAGRGAEDHPDRHPHVAFAIPAARVVRRALRFQIEVHDVARHRSQ